MHYTVLFKLVALFVSLCFLSKTLLVSVHNFIHLNLAIALLLGYILFLGGIETATATTVNQWRSCSVACVQECHLSSFRSVV